MISRRDFLKTSSIVSMAPVLPHVFGRTAKLVNPKSDESVLVVVQLDGGNDGLNTVVPYSDDHYHRARKKLRLPEKDLHRLNDQLGLHPAMKAAKELFDDGRLSIIQGVGYPNPDRSHFRSMRIWQTASFDNAKHDGEGWLGQALNSSLVKGPRNSIYIGGQEVPVALWGRSSEAIAISRADDLELAMESNVNGCSSTALALDQFVSKQVLMAYKAAKDFREQGKKLAKQNKPAYPRTRLGNQLELVAKFLKSGTNTRIFYTKQDGYDTHAAQYFDHFRLLSELANALKSFLDDLKSSGLEDRVVIMTFSEFGRRIKENDSQGTDHGTAGPVFLAGSPVRGGLVGNAPDLADLIDGDLKLQTDFRSIYSTILSEWLNVESEPILGEKFELIDIF